MNGQLISKTWFSDPPYDYEYKQYVILGYLQSVDYSFLNKKLSPHFLFLSELILEMNNFIQSFNEIKNFFDKERYLYFDDNSKLIGEKNEYVDEIIELIDFSKPQIEIRLKTGEKILKKNKQILYF